MFAVYDRKYKGKMVPLKDCILFDTEQQAMWYCVLNPGFSYRKIEG